MIHSKVHATIKPGLIKRIMDKSENKIVGRLNEFEFIVSDLHFQIRLPDNSSVFESRKKYPELPSKIGDSLRILFDSVEGNFKGERTFEIWNDVNENCTVPLELTPWIYAHPFGRSCVLQTDDGERVYIDQKYMDMIGVKGDVSSFLFYKKPAFTTSVPNETVISVKDRNTGEQFAVIMPMIIDATDLIPEIKKDDK